MKLIKSCMDWKAISTVEQRWDESVRQVFVSEFRKDVLELDLIPPETPVFHDSQCTPDYFSDQLLRCAQQWWCFLVHRAPAAVFSNDPGTDPTHPVPDSHEPPGFV